MANLIEPKVLKGFRDFLPPAEITRRAISEKIEASFRSFGFVPIDTPALEYAEILLGKGGGETEKQIYRFTDNGSRDVALRFDLTVPFARFVALHQGELVFPFKRYHIAKVWRGENTQRGRYREFTQCDFDIIGSDSAAADFEILLMIRATLQSLGTDVCIHLNHRGLFNRFLAHIGAADKSVEVLRAVDKLAKVGVEETRQSLAAIAGEDGAAKILEFTGAGTNAAGTGADSFEQTLQRITALSGGPSPESERLAALRRFMRDMGGDGVFVLDPSITRGLDYYTGVVFETFLTELPEIGSICSGGRYDNLAALYSKNRVSGVGSSIGLDRMLAALESLGRLPAAASYAQVAIACADEARSGAYQALAVRFREAGVPCEVFLEAGDKLVRQFMLAEKKGIAYLVIPGENPLRDPLTLRDLQKRQNREGLSFETALELVKRLGLPQN
jgi:histidyl-tRNA synthetase